MLSWHWRENGKRTEKWHVNILKVVPRCCFLIIESKGNKKKKITVSRLASTSAVNSRNFSDTLVWLNNSEKYKRNFPENPRHNHKSQSPNLSVYQEIIETKKIYPKLGGVNDCMKNPTSRRECDGRKKRGRNERKFLFLLCCWIFIFFIKLTGPMLKVGICV